MLKYCNPTKIGKISVILIQKMSNSGIFVQEKQEKRGGMSTRQKVCPAPRYQHAQHPHLCHGGDDDRRRAFPPPRRWWQPCVTPYFATRGRGDMRGMPNRSTSIAPRRWCGVYHLVYHMVVWCNDGLPPPPGWHIWGAVLCSPHVADTPVGEIRGYAQLPPPAGVADYFAFCHHRTTAPPSVEATHIIAPPRSHRRACW